MAETIPHDWGLDSYRCIRCGVNRDDAADQPCILPEIDEDVIGLLEGGAIEMGITDDGYVYVKRDGLWAFGDSPEDAFRNALEKLEQDDG